MVRALLSCQRQPRQPLATNRVACGFPKKGHFFRGKARFDVPVSSRHRRHPCRLTPEKSALFRHPAEVSRVTAPVAASSFPQALINPARKALLELDLAQIFALFELERVLISDSSRPVTFMQAAVGWASQKCCEAGRRAPSDHRDVPTGALRAGRERLLRGPSHGCP